MKNHIDVIIAVIIVILSFGMTHSLKGAWEAINLIVMGMALLYLIFVTVRAKKTDKDA